MHPTLARLVELDTLKTWSLVATLFGDLDGTALTGAQIRRLLSHIGIKPEAIRVALHRLKSDGWITSSKQGREAIYRMTAAAQAETDAVAPDIYTRTETQWHFQLFEDGPDSKGAILLNKNLAIVPGSPELADGALVLRPQTRDLPAWVAETLVSKRLTEIAEALGPLTASYSELEESVDQMAFRLLVLHHWRRIALRPGSWAHASFVTDGPIAQCHRKVIQFLASTDRIPESL
ncbi:MAG: hypothetical protein AAGA87_04630 [Pseudomonadota bacterium]